MNLKLYDKKKPIDLQWGVVVNHDYSTAISLNCGGNYRLRQNLETFMAFWRRFSTSTKLVSALTKCKRVENLPDSKGLSSIFFSSSSILVFDFNYTKVVCAWITLLISVPKRRVLGDFIQPGTYKLKIITRIFFMNRSKVQLIVRNTFCWPWTSAHKLISWSTFKVSKLNSKLKYN